MKKKIVMCLLLTSLLAASVPAAFAQARGALSIVCNVNGAEVYLNGELAGYTKPSFSALLRPGTYTVRVTMDRYRIFETVISMTSNPLNLSVKLLPEGAAQQQSGRYNLTVTTNVAGAQVFVENTQVGTAPLAVQVRRGNYSVRVSAPGYQDYLTSVRVAGNTAVNAVLQLNLLQLNVNCNVAGAQVYVNSALAGTVPYTGAFAPGSYTLRVTAPGYEEAGTVINLNRNETVRIVLQASLVSVRIVIPAGFLDDGDNRDWDTNNRNSRDQIRLFVDGQFYNNLSFDLAAGRHNIRISSGAFSFDADFDFLPGRNYVLEPVISWRAR